jgi:hypothetical protein
MRTHDAFPNRHEWHTLARAVADLAGNYNMASESAYSESLGTAFLVPVTLPLVCELAANDSVDALTLVEYVLREMPTHVIARCYDNGQCELWLYDTLTDAMPSWDRLELDVDWGDNG